MTNEELSKIIEEATLLDASHKLLIVKAPTADVAQIQNGFQSFHKLLKDSGTIILFQGGDEIMACFDFREGKVMHNEFDRKELAKILRSAAKSISK